MSSFGWLYFLIIYTRKELLLALSLPPSIPLHSSLLLSVSQWNITNMLLKIHSCHFKVIKPEHLFVLEIKTEAEVRRQHFPEQNLFAGVSVCVSFIDAIIR